MSDQQTPPSPPPEPARKAVVQTGSRNLPLIPTDMESAFRMASAFAASGMLPKTYYSDGKEAAGGKAFTAMQIGAEVGLLPMQAIQSIAVVNGNATIWGDTQKGLVENSGLCEYIHESYEGELMLDEKTPNPEFKAICATKRIGRAEVREEFTQADAKRAGLWGKSGPWTTHPKRMMRYKARAFVLRDVYPDVLKGLVHSREEMEGEMLDVTPTTAQGMGGSKGRAAILESQLAAESERRKGTSEQVTDVVIEQDKVESEESKQVATEAPAATVATMSTPEKPIEGKVLLCLARGATVEVPLSRGLDKAGDILLEHMSSLTHPDARLEVLDANEEFIRLCSQHKRLDIVGKMEQSVEELISDDQPASSIGDNNANQERRNPAHPRST